MRQHFLGLNFMKSDKISITILPDGTIKMDTDRISQPNHLSAEKFILECTRLAGGTSEVKAKHGHHHHGTHTHTHEEDHHHH